MLKLLKKILMLASMIHVTLRELARFWFSKMTPVPKAKLRELGLIRGNQNLHNNSLSGIVLTFYAPS